MSKLLRRDKSMKNTNKTYIVNDIKYKFSPLSFNAFVNVKKYQESEKGNKLTKTKIT